MNILYIDASVCPDVCVKRLTYYFLKGIKKLKDKFSQKIVKEYK